MNRNRVLTRVIVSITILYAQWCITAIIVHGDDFSLPRGFTRSITAKAFDRQSGAFFVGLGPLTQGVCTRVDTIIDQLVAQPIPLVSRAVRPNFSYYPVFRTIVAADALKSRTEFLVLSPQQPGNSILGAVFPDESTDNYETKIMYGFEEDGTHILQAPFTPSSTPLFPDGFNDANGSLTAGIMGLAASPDVFFVAVRPTAGGVGAYFGQEGSGIAVACIKRICNQLSCLMVKNANTGASGNLAVPFDNTSSAITDGQVAFNVTATCDTCSTHTSVTMYYDIPFERLYIGVSFVTPDGSASNSIAIGTLNGSLSINAIVDRTAITGGATNEVVVIDGVVDGGLQVNHLAVMHASTGPSYLIVNGNRTDLAGSPCNQIFALPLVDDPCTPLVHGTLAKKDSALANNKFVVPATAPGDLATADEPAANIGLVNTTIGGGQLPIEQTTGISDMVVVGDTVYVAISVEPDQNNDTGIFYSQALFGPDGRIVRWTPWTKRAIPLNAFDDTLLPCDTTHTGPVCFLDVDAKTGNIWFVEGNTRRVVGITSWTRGLDAVDITTQLNKYLGCGSFSVLDLDQSTPYFTTIDPTQVTPYRYALFGGLNTVAIAKESVAKSVQPLLDTPQAPITACTKPNVIITDLPAGCVTSLEYTRTFTNFFFAGSCAGLFAFADNAGNGFFVDSLGELNQPPFTTNTWQQVPNIPGAVIDIKTSGAVPVLYVLVTESTLGQPRPSQSTLYSIPFTSSIATMFTPSNISIIAQTGIGIFANVAQFYGIQIIATGPVDSINPATPPMADQQQQLILATNQGLYKTNVTPQLFPFNAPTSQTDAQWQLIKDPQDPNGTESYMFNAIAGIDTPIRHTVWPLSLRALSPCQQIEHGRVDQLSGDGSAIDALESIPEIGTFLPEPFTYNNAHASTHTARAFNKLNPITYFWSDGARRFFILNRVQDSPNTNKLAIIPYDIQEWNATFPTILTYPTLRQEQFFYWIKQIGATGLLMAGTNRGVISLE
jgi:hypothetical protein